MGIYSNWNYILYMNRIISIFLYNLIKFVIYDHMPFHQFLTDHFFPFFGSTQIIFNLLIMEMDLAGDAIVLNLSDLHGGAFNFIV